MLLLFLVTSIVVIEIYPRITANKKEVPLALHSTPYYGDLLDYDPYQAFTIQHLHPYYVFSLPWREEDRAKANNPHVNIAKDGFRVNHYESSSRAVLLGGSTAFGHYSSSDDATIAAVLSRRLNARVVNRNAPSWNSHQEVVALAKFHDDYAFSISFSTANDISVFCEDQLWKRKYYDQPESFEVLSSFFNDIRGEPVRKTIIKREITRLLPHSAALYSRVKKKYFSKKTSLGHLSVYCDGANGARKVAESILSNQKSMREITRGRGGKHFLIIQPWYPLHDKADNEIKIKLDDQIKFRNMVYAMILRDEFCQNSCLDLSKVFDDYDFVDALGEGSLLYDGTIKSSINAVFKDHVHITDNGVNFVSNRIEEFLKSRVIVP
jgi:lysophospholipase L1-like esterase